MFIRFKRRKLAGKDGGVHQYSLHASLVESYRQNGKPRQRTVLYLGSIREEDLADKATTLRFLKTCTDRIQKLNQVPSVTAQFKVSFADQLLRLQAKKL